MILEYIWLASDQSLRSKTKTYYGAINSVKDVPKWNYDGSSCGQALGIDSEIILVNAIFIDPFRNNFKSYLVLCKRNS